MSSLNLGLIGACLGLVGLLVCVLRQAKAEIKAAYDDGYAKGFEGFGVQLKNLDEIARHARYNGFLAGIEAKSKIEAKK